MPLTLKFDGEARFELESGQAQRKIYNHLKIGGTDDE